MALMRKALFIATAGLSGIVLPDDSKKARPKKAAPSKTRASARAKSTPKASRAKSKTPRAPARKSAPRKSAPKAAPAAPAAPMARAMPSTAGTAGELERIAELRGQGALSDAEFAAAKAKILGIGIEGDNGAQHGGFRAVEANVAAARRLADMAGDGSAAQASTGA